MENTILKLYASLKEKRDILEFQVKKMKIMQALVLLITLWSSRAEHVLNIQDAFN